jgi:hypothetical protein
MPLFKLSKINSFFKKKSVSKNNIFNISKHNKKNKKNKHLITFAPHFEKKITNEQISSFWDRYLSNGFKELIKTRLVNKKTNHISQYNPQIMIFPFSPSVGVTVRILSFNSHIIYIKRYKALSKYFKNKKLKHSKIVLVDILSSKKLNNLYYGLVERVFPSLTIHDLEIILKEQSVFFRPEDVYYNRYSSSFINKLKDNKISSVLLLKHLKRATNELYKNSKIIENFDEANNNVVILDYNKLKGTFKFGLIDFYGRGTSNFFSNIK